MKDLKCESSIAGLVKEFGAVLEHRDRLNVDLVRVVAAIRAIAGLPGQEGVDAGWIRDMEERIWNPQPSLRTGVRMSLELSGKLLTPREIKEDLVSHGYDLRKYAFSIAAIHGALKALIRAGNIEQAPDSLGRKAYRWKTSGIDNV